MTHLSKTNLLIVICAFAVIIYNEYLEFFALRSSQWGSAQRELPEPSENHVRILFIGDPQIQGEEKETFLIGRFSRWDSDYYLKKYYEAAKNFLDPHVIIFMGDLLDDGSIVSVENYGMYAKRFRNIFEVPDDVLPIYLAGDNDVGGEDGELINAKKTKQFEKYFAPLNEVLQYKHLQFFKLDVLPLIDAVPDAKLDPQFQKILEEFRNKVSSSTTKILLTHNAIAVTMLHRHIKTMQILHPSYAFSAHSHYSGVITHNLRNLMEYFFKIYPNPNNLIDSNYEGNIVMQEYRVPTCSYRMGVPNMGYAAAVFDEDGKLHYTLLWLPSRFKQLRRYLILFIIITAFLALKWCRRRR